MLGFLFFQDAISMYPRLALNLLCIQVGLEVVILLHAPPKGGYSTLSHQGVLGIQPKQLNTWYNWVHGFQCRRNSAGDIMTGIGSRCRWGLTGLHLSFRLERSSPNRQASLWVVTKTELLWSARMATLHASLCHLFLIRAPIHMFLIP